MRLLREVQHLVPRRGHAAPAQPRPAADEAEAAGEEAVQQRVVREVQRLLPLQGQLPPVRTCNNIVSQS